MPHTNPVFHKCVYFFIIFMYKSQLRFYSIIAYSLSKRKGGEKMKIKTAEKKPLVAEKHEVEYFSHI